MNIKDKISNLLNYLPLKDQSLGQKFLEDRNYEGLKDLVDSALYMANKATEEGNITSSYFNCDLDGLEDLQVEVDAYCEPFIVPTDNDTDDDDYKEEEYD
jgi:hypothetical protein